MIITAYFSDQGAPKAGLSPVINIRDVSDGSLVIDAAAMTEIGDGFYKYDFAGFDAAKGYAILCDGGSGLTGAERYAIATSEAQGDVTRILADTNELQTDLVDGGRLDLLIDGIKGKTDNLPADTASELNAVDAAIAAVQADLDNPDQYKADVSTLALEASVQAVKARTDNLPIDPADQSQVEAVIVAAVAAIQGVDGDTLESLSDQMDGLVPGGTGASAVVITIREADLTPIADVSVRILNEGETLLVAYGSTDVNGQIQINLDDGVYTVRLRKTGCAFTVPEDLTVSGVTAVAYTGEQSVIGEPEDSDACRVYDYAFAQDGKTPLSSVSAIARIVSVPYDRDEKLHAGVETAAVYDPETGLLYWDIVRGATVKFVVAELRYNRQHVVPDQATARLAGLSEL